MDHGEDPAEAAAREILEEAGITILPRELDLVGLWGMNSRDYPGTWALTAFYTAFIPVGVVLSNPEPEKAGPWVFHPPHQLPSPLFCPSYKVAIETAVDMA